MKPANFLKLFDTYGRMAIASLLICGLTGVFLVIPFDPVHAYLSVSTFVTFNPAASFARNIHYWSAQLFLIFTILHFVDHFRSTITIKSSNRSKKGKLTHGTWLRLVLSLMVVFYVMLSGFILKDDADSRQAHLLLTSLLASLPLAGEFISNSLAGKSDSLIVIYLHHAATATIIIFIVIFEHVREIRVKWPTFIYTTIIITILSILFRAPLAQPDESIMKGPWYFIGVQELLHQFSNPIIVVNTIILVVALIYLVPLIKFEYSRFLRISVWVFVVIYALLTIIGYFFRGPFYQWQTPFKSGYEKPVTLSFKPVNYRTADVLPIVEVNGRIEGCMSCHRGMKGLSVSHNPQIIGCFSCHGGDPYTLNATAAHKEMFKVPGNISNSKATCGKNGCHENIVERLPRSMMATLSGMIAVDKWVFGEMKSPDGSCNVGEMQNSSASDIHLRNLCAGCHLGMEKTKPGKAGWLERGGGCNACHLTYTEEDLASLDQINKLKSNVKSSSKIAKLKNLSHPKIDLNITNDKCESCHSRSGRISMSYAGWHETSSKELPQNNTSFKKLPDGRIFTKQPADVHHEAGLQCIDCHGSTELMGDGKSHKHKEDAVNIACQDCHDASIDHNRYRELSATNRESQLIAWLRGWSSDNHKILVTKSNSTPVLNVWFDTLNHKKVLISKSTGKMHELKAPLQQCIGFKAHERLSCESCHTAWVPQCIGCHNAFEEKTIGYDMLKRKTRKGTWIEYTGEALSDAPVLGIKNSNLIKDQQKIGIFSPGMIMTIGDSKINQFHRLYAPVSGHTTQRIARTCKSCHLDPLAIGYGRGTLKLSKNGVWSLASVYAPNKHDNLPEDAWIGFLQERTDQSVTRQNMRPFNLSEQKRILRVGACLTCHDEKSDVIIKCLINFEEMISKSTSKCIRPN